MRSNSLYQLMVKAIDVTDISKQNQQLHKSTNLLHSFVGDCDTVRHGHDGSSRRLFGRLLQLLPSRLETTGSNVFHLSAGKHATFLCLSALQQLSWQSCHCRALLKRQHALVSPCISCGCMNGYETSNAIRQIARCSSSTQP